MKESGAIVVGKVGTFTGVALRDAGYKIFRSFIKGKEGFSVSLHMQ